MNLHFIALKATKHSDSQTILTAYSRELGRVAFALPAGTGKSAARMRALTMPLSLVECASDPRPGREILPMRQVVQSISLAELHSDPFKQMIAMFVAEVLAAVLQSGGADEGMYEFLEAAVRILDGADSRQTANFHICFLYNLGRRLGIEPDVSTYTQGSLLDMEDGTWRMTAPLHRRYLGEEASLLAWRLSRMTFANMHRFRFNRMERNAILDGILEYFSIHYVSMRRLHSLDILRSLL